MKVGIISDTHDLLRPEVIETLQGYTERVISRIHLKEASARPRSGRANCQAVCNSPRSYRGRHHDKDGTSWETIRLQEKNDYEYRHLDSACNPESRYIRPDGL